MKIKLRLISLMLTTSLAWSAEVKLPDDSDHLKLGELVESLPINVKLKNTVPAIGPLKGHMVTSFFPKSETGPFRFKCESTYYNDSPYASAAKCRVDVDVNHQEFDRHYDQIKIMIKDNHLVDALYATIPYSIPQKKFFSWGRDNGTTFDGKYGIIFHYSLNCTTKECRLNLSNKTLVE
ncbi:MAG TPA: hypothetical protein VNJ08_07965 [Bacteriovoracaceae bacterium]|nr:hypothetical protein [Bacteriovoracaceae bacterium]